MKIIKILIMIFLTLCLIGNSSLAEVIVDVDIEPDEPEPASQITITADIKSEKEIDKVYIVIQECKKDLCFTRENVSMNLVDNVYRTTYKLTKTAATYFEYSFSIKFDDGQWFETEITNVMLKSSSNNSNGGNGENNKTPGFEILLFVIAILLVILLSRRKRLR
ncbi:MAG: hypothetical protein QHH15_03710 [Candidatus Thermoplasmatota archaeon]|jgi:hypothetical protein|nr:hypothetical protein [Candidatus Thermoplasmatota archaeon]